MSFRDNLLHLRSTHNMTQEQLAMLLGVSRQSVTKWEADKTSPEMDKLLKMCQIFDCTLDELVQGDLTGREADPAKTMPEAGGMSDICGHEEHSLKMAWKIPTGVAAIILGVALMILLLAFSGESESNRVAALSIAVLFAGIIAGLAFIIPARMEHTAFCKAHPYVEDFYTAEEKAHARSRFAFELVAGIALIFAGICATALSGDTRYELYGVSVLMFCIAVGVWLIINGGVYVGRTNLAERNRDAATEIEFEDILNAQIDETIKQELLAAKKKDRRLGSICGIIMLTATILALICLFASPIILGVNLGVIFWMFWPIGGIGCAIAAMALNLNAGDE